MFLEGRRAQARIFHAGFTGSSRKRSNNDAVDTSAMKMGRDANHPPEWELPAMAAPGCREPRYLNFKSTWQDACAASVYGSIYLALLCAQSAGMADAAEVFLALLAVGIIISLPCGLLGFATVGWWITQYVGRRVKTNRVPVFAMAGMLLGLVVDVLLLACSVAFSPTARKLPGSAEAWMTLAMWLSVPVFYMMVAGITSALRWTRLERRR